MINHYQIWLELIAAASIRLLSILAFDAAGDFVLHQCVFGCAEEALHSVRGIFEQLFCQDAFDLCNERVGIVVGVAADFIFAYVDCRECRQHLFLGFWPYFELGTPFHGAVGLDLSNTTERRQSFLDDSHHDNCLAK